MNHLLKRLAPIADPAWQQIETEARSRLEAHLAARRLVDFHGPLGWTHSAHNLGRVTPVDPAPAPGMQARLRQVLALVELRVPFTLARADLEDAARGDAAIELAPVAEAARTIALGENAAVIHGYGAGGITGLAEASPHEPVQVHGDGEAYAAAVTAGVERLRQAGIDGPYGLALSPPAWTAVIEGTEHGGYPLLEHLRQITGGPIVWAPGVEGAVMVSQRGGDYIMECGQDLSIGYLDHGAENVTLYLEESFTFRVLEPEAAIAIRA
ncbi:MAG: family 1 encapsulin nanocompartment shell protein [Acidimicrobiales bacterium]